MADIKGISIRASLVLAGETYDVTAFDGVEQLNRPYQFTINLALPKVTDSGHQRAADPASWIGAACKFVIEISGLAGSAQVGASQKRVFDSIVLTSGRVDDALTSYQYVVEIGPKLASLGLTRHSMIFAQNEMSLSSLLDEKILSLYPGYVNYLIETYKSDFDQDSGSMVTQFQESDLAFVSRICEAAGIFYFFPTLNDLDQKEMLAIADGSDAFGTTALELDYDTASAPYASSNWLISFANAYHLQPKKVEVHGIFDVGKDHLFFGQATSGDDINGRGDDVDFVTTMDFKSDIGRLKTARSDELASHRVTYTGKSTAVGLSAASRFTVTPNPFSDTGKKYFVEKVRHTYGTLWSPGQVAAQVVTYTNTFECVSTETKYRPQRLLPKPVMPGVYYGTIAASQTNPKRAEINASGRYRIKLRFDEKLVNDPTVLHSWMTRRAEPYGGTQGVGQHFPLLAGTEVVVAFVNGDPDRPVILGAVSTAQNQNPVTERNSTVNKILTLSGIKIEMNDGLG